ncbi:2OG-Fe dioxygenase family protein [Saccharothrix coeruleofusca]|uniref:2OG-Fe dioxygenase family protein n=1 Tax=Saccharothrix coeruleofusca TaxID=33919 RepID=A0A918APW3_9PSEU|nr:2OG-Fe dioxygenase family protein [Saccharothrix coeruleofusca]MBP2337201.1 hypothetical protein [Saccharothrix coeruleofusca]GGP66453.1 hypothetical protein GCM10010185_43970 [Saccharothrix coeruleofusca]
MVAPQDSPSGRPPPRGARIAAEVVPRLRREGFAFVEPEEVLECTGCPDAWRNFGTAWERLPVDGYLREGERFRSRRYGRFRISSDSGLRERPHGPYHQSLQHNGYAGGIQRHYSAIEAATSDHRIFTALVEFDCTVVSQALSHTGAWEIEVHLFRITSGGPPATPTPEGVHRDGNDAFAVHVVDYRCRGGATRIYSLDGEVLHERTMTRPAETLYVDDARVLHDVTPICPRTNDVAGTRDVMIVDFHRGGPGA